MYNPDRRAREQPRKLLIRGARQLLTLRGLHEPRRGAGLRELNVIPDGALLIVDGVIRAVGPSRRVERLGESRNAVELDASGKVVMPCFIDSYTMLLGAQIPLDDYDARCAQGGFHHLQSSEREATAAFSAQRMNAEGGRRLRQLLRSGTGAVASAGVATRSEAVRLRALRVLRRFSKFPLSVLSVYNGPVESLAPLRRQGLARIFSIDKADSDGAVLEAAGKARALDFPVKITGRPKLAAAASASCVTGRFACGAGEIQALSASSCVAVLTPAVDFFCGEEPLPARKLVDEGAAVALATGYGVAACPTWSMPAVIALSCLLLRLTPAEAIAAATINAAFALGAERRSGSLEQSKDADLLLLSCGDYREIGLFTGVNPVAAVIKRGEIVFPRIGAA